MTIAELREQIKVMPDDWLIVIPDHHGVQEAQLFVPGVYQPEYSSGNFRLRSIEEANAVLIQGWGD